jgi:signal transduction histidine kinase
MLPFRAAAAACAAVVMMSATVCFAASKTTPDEAKALAIQAANLVSQKGLDAARKAFNEDATYKHDDIYVTVMDLKAAWVIYPLKPAAEGQSALNIKDADGKMLAQEMLSVATGPGEGWVEYRWMNPTSSKIEPKLTFVKRIPNHDLFTFVGIYK